MVSLFKKVVALATREGRNEGGSFATVWKRRQAMFARTTMIDQAHYALRKHFADDMKHFADDKPIMLYGIPFHYLLLHIRILNRNAYSYSQELSTATKQHSNRYCGSSNL